MAQRPVFRVRMRPPFYETVFVDFIYNGGFAASQKQKNIVALHAGYARRFANEKVLEISSKSLQEVGVALSAFNLLKYVPSIGRGIPVENVFQGAKKFIASGPYADLYGVTPLEAKRDQRLTASGRLTAFCFENEQYPLEPKTAFYDWIYINALLENAESARAAAEYGAFTDIEFNPDRSINCQARAAAVFASLTRLGLTEKAKDFSEYLSLITAGRIGRA